MANVFRVAVSLPTHWKGLLLMSWYYDMTGGGSRETPERW